MTISSATSVGTASYLSSGYARMAAAGASGNGSSAGNAASSSSSASATVVTLSAAAQAALTQSAVADFAAVTTNARAALDALYKAANVTAPFADDGKPTIDLAALDRRALYAIASNGGGKFTSDEQKVAANELQARFDAVVSPQTAVARLTGDWSQVYKAALDDMQGAGPEEQASATWKAQVAALQQGYAAAVASPGSAPATGADDPVAAFLARTGTDGTGGTLRDFSQVAADVRTALDLQKQAAGQKGVELVYDSSRKGGQMADLSAFDNRALSAISLNQGGQFSPQEIRAGKAELDSRTRASLLAAFKQSRSSSDPRAFSLGLIYNYAQMSPEERQATNFTTDFRDTAVKSYQSTSALISLLQQAAGGNAGFFG